ncbi:c-type cytochrome [Roseateles noduli]|uniref:c-type cytochrome n=1 Tax=Roseateles noduli TaxID=2052484 RepID=UPI003D662A51
MKRVASLVVAVAVLGVAGYAYLNRVDPNDGTAPLIAGAPADAPLLVRGEYLAKAADCVACHTAKGGGTPFAGGLAFSLPFGKLYAPNITPDVKTGIGAWTDDQFVKAIHDGVRADGQRLYPAFPYTSYTQLSRADILAIKAYLFSLTPVEQKNKEPELMFPFNQRWAMGFWNAVFFKNERFQPNPEKSTQWNTGAYMAVALAHCAECHTPRNIGFALNKSNNMAGEVIQGWKAPNITSDPKHGLGSWSNQEIADYLMKGHAQGRGSAAGPMAEAVENSLQYMNRQDIDALITYLRDVPAREGKSPTTIDPRPPLATTATAFAPASSTVPEHELGMRLFSSACASCHQWNGVGQQTAHASLLGARSVNDPEGTNVMQIVLEGVNVHVQGKAVYMPAFGHAYSDTEIAAVSNFVIQQYGNKKGLVTPKDVAEQRKKSE